MDLLPWCHIKGAALAYRRSPLISPSIGPHSITQVKEQRTPASSNSFMQAIDMNLPAREGLRRKCTAPSPISGTQFTPQATEILPHLYISDLYTATDVSFLASHQITHRLSVQTEPVEPPYCSSALKLKHIPLADKCDARLWMYLDSAADWIHAALSKEDEQNNVLIHCRWGKSRSVSLVLAYLMKYRGMALTDALAFVQARREISQPNTGFMRQLKAYKDGMKGIGGRKPPSTQALL